MCGQNIELVLVSVGSTWAGDCPIKQHRSIVQEFCSQRKITRSIMKAFDTDFLCIVFAQIAKIVNDGYNVRL